MKTMAYLATGALLCAAAHPAQAQTPDRHFYVGVDVGQSALHRNLIGIDPAAGSDTHALAWKLRFGYRFSQTISLETAYSDFGDYDGAEQLAFPTVAAFRAPGEFTTSAKGIDVSVVGTWPVGEIFHVNGSIGLIRREYETVYAPLTVNLPGQRLTDGDIGSQFGLGFGFTLSESMDIDVNWVTTNNLEGDVEFRANDADPSLVSLGLRFKF